MLLLSQWEISLTISRLRDLGHLRRSLWETSVSHYKKKNLLSHCRKMAGILDWCNHMIRNKIVFACKRLPHWKPEQKMIKGKHIGSIPMRKLLMTLKGSTSLKSDPRLLWQKMSKGKIWFLHFSIVRSLKLCGDNWLAQMGQSNVWRCHLLIS